MIKSKLLFLCFLALNCTHLIVAQSFSFPRFHVVKNTGKGQKYYCLSPVKLSPKGNSLPMSLILDASGEILIFKSFGNGPFAGCFVIHPNGLLSYFHAGKFFILDKHFNLIDSISCVNNRETDSHELLILNNGNYVLIGTETITMDLSSYPYFGKKGLPGSKNAQVICNVIQELNPKKELVFEWRTKDHYQFSDVDPYFLNDSLKVDWMHINAIEVDSDSNYLLSLRNFNEITKVNKRNGEIMWRFGGKGNQFNFVNDSLRFYGQHDIRKTNNQTFTLFDNGRNTAPFHPEGAKEYELNLQKKEAKLIWNHIQNSQVCSSGYGSVKRQNNKATLIGYGRSENANIVFNEVDDSGQITFEIASVDSLRNYRVYAYDSVPFDTTRPLIKKIIRNGKSYLIASGYKNFIWSDGTKGNELEIKQKGSYRVYALLNHDTYICSLPVHMN